jgi:hypothetical protein
VTWRIKKKWSPRRDLNSRPMAQTSMRSRGLLLCGDTTKKVGPYQGPKSGHSLFYELHSGNVFVWTDSAYLWMMCMLDSYPPKNQSDRRIKGTFDLRYRFAQLTINDFETFISNFDTQTIHTGPSSLDRLD